MVPASADGCQPRRSWGTEMAGVSTVTAGVSARTSGRSRPSSAGGCTRTPTEGTCTRTAGAATGSGGAATGGGEVPSPPWPPPPPPPPTGRELQVVVEAAALGVAAVELLAVDGERQGAGALAAARLGLRSAKPSGPWAWPWAWPPKLARRAPSTRWRRPVPPTRWIFCACGPPWVRRRDKVAVRVDRGRKPRHGPGWPSPTSGPDRCCAYTAGRRRLRLRSRTPPATISVAPATRPGMTSVPVNGRPPMPPTVTTRRVSSARTPPPLEAVRA